MADQEWQFAQFPGPDGHQDAATFLNDPYRQGRGEASVTLRNDGSAGLIYFEPGSLGEETSPSWLVGAFPSAQAAADFLNTPPRQGSGEASVTLRNDGSAGLLYLEPGSLGGETSPSWLVGAFPSVQTAVDFLNATPRQGPGEASVTPRSNGTVRLLYLEAGSLGNSTRQAWQVAEFASAQEAVDFLNASPRQGAGEASGFIRNNGSAVVFYLEPGSA